jgi:hypothetical protein
VKFDDQQEFLLFLRELDPTGPASAWASALEAGMSRTELEAATPAIVRAIRQAIYAGERSNVTMARPANSFGTSRKMASRAPTQESRGEAHRKEIRAPVGKRCGAPANGARG